VMMVVIAGLPSGFAGELAPPDAKAAGMRDCRREERERG
jgi:hypothetical protein